MFEDTLLILKADYMHKRRPVLLYVLKNGFFVQASRKLRFSPEQAAEFHTDLAQDKRFMLEVILLSKGTCEAFILCRENAVEQLNAAMVCYFGNSQEMNSNIHICRTVENVRHEVRYVFPNYIHEPIPFFESHKFCKVEFMGPMIAQVYDIIETEPNAEKNWKKKLSDWLKASNRSLPHISNLCCSNPSPMREEKGQQTIESSLSKVKEPGSVSDGSDRASLSASSKGSSMMLTSSTCITCSCFGDSLTCLTQQHVKPEESCDDLIKPKTAVKSTSTISCHSHESIEPEPEAEDDVGAPEIEYELITEMSEEEHLGELEDEGIDHIDIASQGDGLAKEEVEGKAMDLEAEIEPADKPEGEPVVELVVDAPPPAEPVPEPEAAAPEPVPEPVAEPAPEPEPPAAAPEPEPEPPAAAPAPEPEPEPPAAAPEPAPEPQPEAAPEPEPPAAAEEAPPAE